MSRVRGALLPRLRAGPQDASVAAGEPLELRSALGIQRGELPSDVHQRDVAGLSSTSEATPAFARASR